MSLISSLSHLFTPAHALSVHAIPALALLGFSKDPASFERMRAAKLPELTLTILFVFQHNIKKSIYGIFFAKFRVEFFIRTQPHMIAKHNAEICRYAKKCRDKSCQRCNEVSPILCSCQFSIPFCCFPRGGGGWSSTRYRGLPPAEVFHSRLAMLGVVGATQGQSNLKSRISFAIDKL